MVDSGTLLSIPGSGRLNCRLHLHTLMPARMLEADMHLRHVHLPLPKAQRLRHAET